jgi:biopolymer transport protein ExbD
VITRPRHELPIVPTANLVDIAILLIIFYMACSNFVARQAGILKVPKAPDLEKVSEQLVLVAIDSQGQISVQGRPVVSAADVESSVAVLLRDKTTPEQRRVMLRCDATVTRTLFEPVMSGIVEAGGTIVAVGEKMRRD